MTNAELISKIKAEIERNMKAIRVLNEHTAPEQMSKACAIFQYSDSILSELLSFLSDLESEKPTPTEGLEEEIARFFGANPIQHITDWPLLKNTALHFAQWGAEHYIKLELLAKFAEMTGSIDTMLKNTLPPLKECEKGLREPLISDDLKEAANNYLDGVYGKMPHSDYHIAIFIAGAKWQEEQDQETIELAEDHAFLAGAVNEREKMMKEAVEGVIEEVSFNNGEQHNTIRFSFDEESLHVENRIWFPRCGKDGDKVKIIIVKEE